MPSRQHPTLDIVPVVILIILLGTMSVLQTLAIRKLDAASVGRIGLADYFRCLVVTDQTLYAELGREGYVRYCETFLEGR